jgi:hypothetical protein
VPASAKGGGDEGSGALCEGQACSPDRGDQRAVGGGTVWPQRPNARVVTDGHAGYNAASLGARKHKAKVQTKDERRKNDAVQRVHWTVSNLKRWLLGTHGGAVKPKYLQAYLDEFVFRYNRPKTAGVGRIAARMIASLVSRGPRTLEDITRKSEPYAAFRR